MKYIYIHFDGLLPKIVTLEQAIEMLADAVIGVANPEGYAKMVLEGTAQYGSASFALNDSGEMLMVVAEDEAVKTDSP
jgi:hypothetical protein